MRRALRRWLRPYLSRAVKPHRILGGSLRGQRIITSWHDYPGAILGRTERPLLNWCLTHVLPGQTWLDVGAHFGYTALALCRCVGAHGRVFAFEPVVGTAGSLSQMRVVNHLWQLTVLPLALGQAEGLQLRTLPVTRGMAYSIGPSLDTFQETLLVTSLDWLWPRIKGAEGHIHGIKIDVQGMEIETIQGMLASLTAHRPTLVIELHQGVSREGLLQLLVDAGYGSMGSPIEPEPDSETTAYLDDRSYVFTPRSGPP